MPKILNHRVFKFGGASVKDAAAVKNVASIITQYGQAKRLTVVVSAMGKTTNALEAIYKNARQQEPYQEAFVQLYGYHFQIAEGLFEGAELKDVIDGLDRYFIRLENTLSQVNEYSFHKGYDQVVSFGELISTFLVYRYLRQTGSAVLLKDARQVIKTDYTWQEGKVDMAETCIKVNELWAADLEKNIIVTQGFIGSAPDGYTTTLGREGSDYTAAILAHCLKAKDVTIWKDVPGILNADPKLFADTHLYKELSYFDASEMTYYGASVIHPKTIKPIALSGIPMYVRSFVQPEAPGTMIHDNVPHNKVPAIIVKHKQTLISFGVKDFTFISDLNISKILQVFYLHNFKINLMQNSAVSLSVVVDSNEHIIQTVTAELKADFKVAYNQNLTLISIKQYNQETISSVISGKEIVLEQKTRHTYQALVTN
jgi:aspartate kinase